MIYVHEQSPPTLSRQSFTFIFICIYRHSFTRHCRNHHHLSLSLFFTTINFRCLRHCGHPSPSIWGRLQSSCRSSYLQQHGRDCGIGSGGDGRRNETACRGDKKQQYEVSQLSQILSFFSSAHLSYLECSNEPWPSEQQTAGSRMLSDEQLRRNHLSLQVE